MTICQRRATLGVMKAAGPILTPPQRVTIERIASGMTQADIARELKIHPMTISDWKKDPTFRAALDAALDDVLTATRERAKGMAAEALSVLRVLMLNEDNAVPHAVRRQAASDLLDRCGITAARVVEVSGRDGGAIRIDARDLTTATTEVLEALAAENREPESAS